MLSKNEIVRINGRNYDVIITRKGNKRTYFRFKNGAFYVTTSYFSFTKTILNFLLVHGSSLIKPEKINLQDNYIYIFGIKYEGFAGKFKVFDKEYSFLDSDDFYKKIKKPFNDFLNERVKYFSNIMGVPLEYKVSVRKMTTRLGSNSKRTNKLTFAANLIHFSKEAIDSVVVHELAHYFYFDHSKKFYDIIYKYCPNYKKLTKELGDKI